jgi:hypothetical protein
LEPFNNKQSQIGRGSAVMASTNSLILFQLAEIAREIRLAWQTCRRRILALPFLSYSGVTAAFTLTGLAVEAKSMLTLEHYDAVPREDAEGS